MATVTADFPVAIECGTSVLAALLTGTWTGDFGPDFGPATGGGGAPAEWTTGVPPVQGNSFPPLEALATEEADWHRVEWAALCRGDATAPAEAMIAVRADPPAPMAALRTQASDRIGASEALLSARADPAAAGEALAVPALDARLPAEALAKAGADAWLPTESLGTLPPVLGDSFAPLEASLAAAGTVPAKAGIEWAAVFRADAAAPAEAVLALRIDPAAPGESIAVYRLDLAPVIEALSAAARIDLSPPVETLLSAVRDGAYVEAASTLQLDRTVPVEAPTGLRLDPGQPTEAGGAIARADAVAPIEALLTALRSGAVAEFLTTVQPLAVMGNVNAPIEWAAVFRADGAPVAEWAALSATDRIAIAEWLRGFAADALPAAEAGATPPAPVLVVGRGRLALSPGRIRLLGPD